MPSTLVEQIYSLASEYVISVFVTQSSTLISAESLKRPGLRKSTMIYIADMPILSERDEYLRRKLTELIEKVRAGE